MQNVTITEHGKAECHSDVIALIHHAMVGIKQEKLTL
jgi:hypothetical protein